MSNTQGTELVSITELMEYYRKKGDKIGRRTIERYIYTLKKQVPKDYAALVTFQDRPGGGRHLVLYDFEATKKFINSCRRESGFFKIRANQRRKEAAIKGDEPPEIILNKEKQLQRLEERKVVNRVNVEGLSYEEKQKFIEGVCEEFQDNEASLRECCARYGLKITDFMKLISTNKTFKYIFEQSNKIRKHVLLADIEYHQERRILEKLTTDEVITKENVIEMVPQLGPDGELELKEVEKGRRERKQKYFPSSMDLNLADQKKQELISLLSTNDDISMPNFDSMSHDQREAKIKELKEKLAEKKADQARRLSS